MRAAERKKNAWRHERNHRGTQARPRAPSSASTIDMDRYALGVDIVIRSKTGDVPAVEYAPIGAMRDEIACAVICAPGSSGLRAWHRAGFPGSSARATMQRCGARLLLRETWY